MLIFWQVSTKTVSRQHIRCGVNVKNITQCNPLWYIQRLNEVICFEFNPYSHISDHRSTSHNLSNIFVLYILIQSPTRQSLPYYKFHSDSKSFQIFNVYNLLWSWHFQLYKKAAFHLRHRELPKHSFPCIHRHKKACSTLCRYKCLLCYIQDITSSCTIMYRRLIETVLTEYDVPTVLLN